MKIKILFTGGIFMIYYYNSNKINNSNKNNDKNDCLEIKDESQTEGRNFFDKNTGCSAM